jgi:hypothetical protein
LVGGEPWQQALYRRLMSHADDQRELLAGYQKVADESHSGAFRYLASLLVEDELRHQRFMSEMARTLQTEVDCRREERAIPPVGQWGFERDHIVELTERFLALEGYDGRELRDLGRDLEGVKDTTVWQLLVRLMEADTDKHIQILRFVNQHARTRPGPSRRNAAARSEKRTAAIRRLDRCRQSHAAAN